MSWALATISDYRWSLPGGGVERGGVFLANRQGFRIQYVQFWWIRRLGFGICLCLFRCHSQKADLVVVEEGRLETQGTTVHKQEATGTTKGPKSTAQSPPHVRRKLVSRVGTGNELDAKMPHTSQSQILPLEVARTPVAACYISEACVRSPSPTMGLPPLCDIARLNFLTGTDDMTGWLTRTRAGRAEGKGREGGAYSYAGVCRHPNGNRPR